MSDVAGTEGWIPKFDSWKEFALPLLKQGKPKEAMAKYPWFTTQGDPFARLGKPVSETRFGLVTTGGYSIEGVHKPFTGQPDFSGAAPEVHVVPLDADRTKFRIDHKGYDHRFAEEDYNVNLPLDRLQELAEAGEIGSVSQDTLALMGLVMDVVPLIKVTIPQIAERFRSDGVEAALLVPS